MTINYVNFNLTVVIVTRLIYYNTVDNLTSVCDYTGVNDDLSNNVLDANINVNVQNDYDNVSCIDDNCLYNAANLQQLVNQSHNLADKVSSIQGESCFTQVTAQHNSGEGTVYNVHIEPVKQQGSYQQNQSLCNSNCFTVS